MRTYIDIDKFNSIVVNPVKKGKRKFVEVYLADESKYKFGKIQSDKSYIKFQILKKKTRR